MGCGSSSVAQEDPLQAAAPIGLVDPKHKEEGKPADAPVAASTPVEGKATADGSSSVPVTAAVAAAPVSEAKKPAESPAPAAASSAPAAAEEKAVVEHVAPSSRAIDPAVLAAVEASNNSAKALFASLPADGNIAGVALDTSYDTPVTEFLGDGDIATVISYIADSECQLFSEATATLEIAPQSIAELILLAGSADAAVAMLKALDARNSKFPSLVEVPLAMHEQAYRDVEAALGGVEPKIKKAALACHAILAKSTCELYPYSVIPTVSAASHENGAPAEESDTELDFNQVNQQLIGTRMRLLFLSPAFLVQLAYAGGASSANEYAKWNAALILQHLSLSEVKFELPTELLRGVFGYRLLSLQKTTTLAAKGDSDPQANEVPQDLQTLVPPLHKSLLILSPSCDKLSPLIDPLIPTLNNLNPTLKHLQVYLGRFLPLLQESHKEAKANNVAPADDKVTAEILQAYLIPFLKLTQPWIIQTRPYLADLQPFFQEVQPFLGFTHAFFTLLQPFLHQLQPNVGVEGQEKPFVVRDQKFKQFLKETIAVLIALHPTLKQLHPLMEGLLSFLQNLGTFLSQLQELLDLLAIYQTEPVEPEAEPTEAEAELSSIARPWFKDTEEGAAEQPKVSAPTFLSKNGQFLSKLTPYTSQLRPFAEQVKSFVEKFVPFVVQLAPFYHDSVKSNVTPLLFFLVPISAEEDDAAPAAAAVPKNATAAEMDEAALQRLLSS